MTTRQNRPASKSAKVVHLASFRIGGPVAIRFELQETLPAHADMLRYDLGFHSPADPSLLIFPWFRHKTQGAYPAELTLRRWESFAIRLAAKTVDESYDCLRAGPGIDEWITYEHPAQAAHYGLVPVTLADWLKAHPGVTIHGWRSLPVVPEGRYWAVTG